MQRILPALPAPAAWKVFVDYTYRMFAANDVAPNELVFVAMAQKEGWSTEDTFWFLILLWAYNHWGSALVAFERFPVPSALDEATMRLPMTTSRRGLRGGRLEGYIASYLLQVRRYGSLCAFFSADFTSDVHHNFERYWRQALCIWGNGRWAACGMAEHMVRGMGWPMEAPDMRLAGQRSVQRGLLDLFGMTAENVWPLAAYNQLGVLALAYARQAAFPHMGYETLETLLCDYQALLRGLYYVGNHIDEELEELIQVRFMLSSVRLAQVWDLRQQVIPWDYLGEYHGWSGSSSVLKRYYRTYRLVGDRSSHADP